MNLRRGVLPVFALLAGAPLAPPLAAGAADAAGLAGAAAFLGEAGTARAGTIRGMIGTSKSAAIPTFGRRFLAVVSDDGEIASVLAEVESDAGGEELTLAASDAWLHGAAALPALPTADAGLTFTLYDSASAALLSFSGSLAADGTVTLKADAGEGADCASRVGCSGDDTPARTPDIEILSAQVIPLYPAGGSSKPAYELSFDLAGADAYDVAYAEIALTERIGSPDGAQDLLVSALSVDWDDIGTVWEGELSAAPEGLAEVKIKTYDAAGKKLEAAKSKLGAPWLDGGEGVSALATDEDPLTSVALIRAGRSYSIHSWGMAVDFSVAIVSEGWTADEAPTHAELELIGGETLTIPANSYQRRMRKRPDLLYSEWESAINEYISEVSGNPLFSLVVDGSSVHVTGGDLSFEDDSALTLDDLRSPVCSRGVCVMLAENEAGEYELSVTAYSADAAELPDAIEITTALVDELGEERAFESFAVELDEDVTAVFANEVTLAEDPVGLDLAGKVSLLGAASSKGKQKTLAKGKFYGIFSRDGDGELSLAGADKGAVSSRGDVLLGGEPLAFEQESDDNGDGAINAPPVAAVAGNGSGTRNASITTSARPQLL